MKWLLVAALFLVLPGCVLGGDLFHQSEPVKPELLTNQQVVPEAVPEVTPTRTPLSPAASAAALSGAKVNSGELLDCVTESCKINCSPKVKKQLQPKWCARFKEPVE
jgi:hypothetical protein